MSATCFLWNICYRWLLSPYISILGLFLPCFSKLMKRPNKTTDAEALCRSKRKSLFCFSISKPGSWRIWKCPTLNEQRAHCDDWIHRHLHLIACVCTLILAVTKATAFFLNLSGGGWGRNSVYFTGFFFRMTRVNTQMMLQITLRTVLSTSKVLYYTCWVLYLITHHSFLRSEYIVTENY